MLEETSAGSQEVASVINELGHKLAQSAEELRKTIARFVI